LGGEIVEFRDMDRRIGKLCKKVGIIDNACKKNRIAYAEFKDIICIKRVYIELYFRI
jgi:hypothetical protein